MSILFSSNFSLIEDMQTWCLQVGEGTAVATSPFSPSILAKTLSIRTLTSLGVWDERRQKTPTLNAVCVGLIDTADCTHEREPINTSTVSVSVAKSAKGGKTLVKTPAILVRVLFLLFTENCPICVSLDGYSLLGQRANTVCSSSRRFVTRTYPALKIKRTCDRDYRYLLVLRTFPWKCQRIL